MNERTNKTVRDLLFALVSQIPEMGYFSVEKETNISELLWSWFRYQGPTPELSPGIYIYRYDYDNDLPNYEGEIVAKLNLNEDDTVYLYQIETMEE